jgi:hypothetical protein
MATSQFSPFGLGAGAFVLPPATWANSPVRTSGFPTGLLPKENLNTPIRQASSIATMIANFIAANQAANVLDDGDLAALLDQFGDALAAFTASSATSYTLGSPTGALTSRVVQLVPGTWQMILQTFLSRDDGGNFDTTATQAASVVGSLVNMDVLTSGHMYRTGGSGHGRAVGLTACAMDSMVVSAAGSFTMTISAVADGGLTCRGSILSLNKIG